VEGVQHPGELEASSVDDGNPAPHRMEVGQVLQSATGKSAAANFDHHRLHVL
jgi:hypothetical protein